MLPELVPCYSRARAGPRLAASPWLQQAGASGGWRWAFWCNVHLGKRSIPVAPAPGLSIVGADRNMYCVRVMSDLALRPGDYEIRICYVFVLRTAKMNSSTPLSTRREELGGVPANDRHLEFKMPRTPRLGTGAACPSILWNIQTTTLPSAAS